MPWKPALEAIREETRDVRKQRVRDFLRETAKTIDERHVELLGRRAEAPPPEHKCVPLQTVKVVIVERDYASGYRTLSAKDVWLPSPPVFSPVPEQVYELRPVPPSSPASWSSFVVAPARKLCSGLIACLTAWRCANQ